MNKIFWEFPANVKWQEIFLFSCCFQVGRELADFLESIHFLEKKKGFKNNALEEKGKALFFLPEEKQVTFIDAKTGKSSKVKRGERNCN